MKYCVICLVVTAALVLASIADAENDGFPKLNGFPKLKGRYFGQKPPGIIPELFAPDIFNAEHGYHSPVVFAHDFTEAVWSPMKREDCLEISRIVDGYWSIPEEINFGLERGVGDAAFWPDGSRIYFTSFHPPYPNAQEKERIWYAEREGTSWSSPRLIDDAVLAHPTHWTFSFADNKDLYFTSEMPGVRGEQDIYLSRFDGEKYLEPIDLGPAINSDGKDLAPFVARNESYLIFTRVGTETRKADLYISFKDSLGHWTEAINMGDDINSEANELCASVSPDGNYLFFISQKNGLMNRIYWVEIASVIDSLARDHEGLLMPQTEAQEDSLSVLTGPYLGQKNPGNSPELFAPGYVSREDYFEHSTAVFSPDMREVYWTAKPNTERYYHMYFMEMIGDTWTSPETVTFSEYNYGERGPAFAPDGNRLYFDHNGDIWMVERQSGQWSAPTLVSEISDPTKRDRMCNVTRDGSVYSIRSGQDQEVKELFVSRIVDGKLSPPMKSNKVIPSGYKAVGDVFVAPDESLMLIELHVDGSTSEVFVSYKMNDGSWSDEIKLPLGWARCPSVSPDGQYIFFMRREGIFWASADILEELRPAEGR